MTIVSPSAAMLRRLQFYPLCLVLGASVVASTLVAAEPLPDRLQQPRSFAYPIAAAPIVQPERLAAPPGTPTAPGYEFAPLASLSTNIAPPAGELPTQHTLPQPTSPGEPLRGEYVYSPESVAIASTSRARHFCHRPLYFEDPLLERDGCSVGVLQPVVSGARFVATIPALPYLMGSRPPRSCVCTDSAGVPHQQITPADRRRGIAAQATSAVGLVFVLP